MLANDIVPNDCYDVLFLNDNGTLNKQTDCVKPHHTIECACSSSSSRSSSNMLLDENIISSLLYQKKLAF